MGRGPGCVCCESYTGRDAYPEPSPDRRKLIVFCTSVDICFCAYVCIYEYCCSILHLTVDAAAVVVCMPFSGPFHKEPPSRAELRSSHLPAECVQDGLDGIVSFPTASSTSSGTRVSWGFLRTMQGLQMLGRPSLQAQG